MAASTASGRPAGKARGNAKRPAARKAAGPAAPPGGGLTAEEITEAQATAAQVPPPRPTVTFKGKEFRVSDAIPEMAIMKFAALAETGIDSRSMAGRTAMHSLLRFAIYQGEPCDCVFADGAGYDMDAGLIWHTAECGWTLGDWAEFEQHAMDTFAEHTDFLNLVVAVIEARTGHPTSPPSGSSPTDGGTSPSSKGSSSSAAAATSGGQADGLTAVDDLLS